MKGLLWYVFNTINYGITSSMAGPIGGRMISELIEDSNFLRIDAVFVFRKSFNPTFRILHE